MQHDDDSKIGAYVFKGDYSYYQRRFLRGIQEQVPEALAALRDTVLPAFVATRTASDERHGYDAATWSALWDWAAHFCLAQADDLPNLKTERALAIAREIGTDYGVCRAPFIYSPFKAESAAVSFNLTTRSRVVLCTLNAWSHSPDAVELRWSFPPDESSIYEEHDQDFLARLTRQFEDGNYPQGLFDARAELRSLAESMGISTTTSDSACSEAAPGFSAEVLMPDPPPYVYSFTVTAWNVRRELREEAASRIMADLRDQLRAHLDRHAAIAERVGHAKGSRKISVEHCDWLALYQVKRLNFTEVARRVGPDHLRQTVKLGIRSAAQFVVPSSSWADWLRQSKPGRRPKSRS